MACSKTKRLAHKICPLYRTTSKQCCYKCTVNSERAAAAVIADAVTRPDYVKLTGPSPLPNNMIQVKVYFKQR